MLSQKELFALLRKGRLIYLAQNLFSLLMVAILFGVFLMLSLLILSPAMEWGFNLQKLDILSFLGAVLLSLLMGLMLLVVLLLTLKNFFSNPVKRLQEKPESLVKFHLSGASKLFTSKPSTYLYLYFNRGRHSIFVIPENKVRQVEYSLKKILSKN